ncbi:hypothetical protein SEA_EDEN_21 [Microbacterium phage Eden]|uniref:Uncharacterized protein n=1 Tax=Microbacterium phage Eden TaxID=2250289 RepID=A0A345KWB4_9CAUD|nr:membrane protein [Microbacterium phage Eden]AXH47316.1 hypothetical protein SEA_EDEN_21 [Microbacterium phage Eden]
MEADIREALSDIKHDVREGFSSTNRRIDDLVTRGEFSATVARLDGQHNTLRRAFEVHETQTEGLVDALRKADIQVLHDSKSETMQLRDEVSHQLNEFRVTTRWAIGLTATGVAILTTLAQWLLTF